MSRKILITGGDGFIARNLFYNFTDWSARFSSLDNDVFSPNREELDLLDSSRVKNYLEEHKFDVVIHAATYDAAPRFSTKDPTAVLENNLRMFFNVAHCKDSFGKMICFGSGAEAGRENWIPMMSEEYIGSNVPPDQYGIIFIMSGFFQFLGRAMIGGTEPCPTCAAKRCWEKSSYYLRTKREIFFT